MAPVPGDSPKTPAWHIDAVRGPSTPSLDHLVGAGDQHRWNVEVKRARRLQIEDKFELGRLQDRKVCGLRALKDAAGVDANLTEHVEKDRSVAHQKAGFDHLAGSIARRHPVAYCQRGKLHSATSCRRLRVSWR